MKQYNKPRKSCALFGLGFVEMIPSPRLGFLRGVFLANHMPSTDNLASNNQDTEHIQTQTNVNTKVLLIRGVYRGESGRNLRPNWAKGGREYTLKGGRIPPDIWVICKCNL